MPTPSPFDPELGLLLTAAPPEHTRTLTPEGIPALAAASSQPTPNNEFIGTRSIQATDYTIPGYQGAEIGVTVFARKDRKPSANAPAFYHIHGGGMVMGHRLLGADFILKYVEQFDGVLATVEYRLAPQHPYPVPVEDCYAGLVWLAAQGEKLGFNPKRIMIIGSSAGAGLAAGVALLARDRSGPSLAWQLLSEPMLDDRNATLSCRQYEHTGAWNAHSNQTGWGAYLGDKLGGPDVPIYAAPGRAIGTKEGLAGLPPAYIEMGSAQSLRDDAVDYANGIWAAGGEADLHVWAGGFHGFTFWGTPRLTVEAVTTRHNWVRRMLEWDAASGTFGTKW
ncbi:alpha/beta hydrolase domain-containing protein [Nemania abortiva]|nr:alpha/beta hydrolase domain-containing protein [Nemania abortiva]